MTRYAPAALAAVLLLAGCHAAPRGLAAPGEPLRPCPSTPDCVSSEAADARHAMPPLAIADAAAPARARMTRFAGRFRAADSAAARP